MNSIVSLSFRSALTPRHVCTKTYMQTPISRRQVLAQMLAATAATALAPSLLKTSFAADAVGTLLMGGTTNANQYDAYYKAIEECCDYASEKNVALVIKPHGGLNSTGEQCRKTIEKVPKKNFRLWYDPGNIFFYSAGR